MLKPFRELLIIGYERMAAYNPLPSVIRFAIGNPLSTPALCLSLNTAYNGCTLTGANLRGL